MKKILFLSLTLFIVNCTSYTQKFPQNPQGGFIVKKDISDEVLMYCLPHKDTERAYCYEVKEK
jgi:hypothetical protein